MTSGVRSGCFAGSERGANSVGVCVCGRVFVVDLPVFDDPARINAIREHVHALPAQRIAVSAMVIPVYG
jgi:hypothetical protein